MSERPSPPRQVLFAAWVAGGAGLAMLLSAGDLASRLHTVDLRESLASELAKGWDDTLPLNVDQLLEVLKVVLLVCGAAAAAVLVLAFFVARRDNRARVGLTVCAVPMFLGGLAVSPFVSGLIAVSVVLLWSQPARAWFAPGSPTPALAAAGGPQPPTAAARSVEAPVRRVEQPSAPPGGADPFAVTRPWPPPARPITSRPPRQVVLACVVTWLVSALVAITMALGAVEVFRPQYRSELDKLIADNPQLRDAGLSTEEVATIAAVMLGIMIVWAAVAIVLAVFTLLGRGWARVALAISAGAAGLLALPATLAQPACLLVVAAGAYTVILLMNRDTSAWLAARALDRRINRGGY